MKASVKSTLKGLDIVKKIGFINIFYTRQY